MKQVNNPSWETSDGQVFSDKREASAHEAKVTVTRMLEDSLDDMSEYGHIEDEASEVALTLSSYIASNITEFKNAVATLHRRIALMNGAKEEQDVQQ